MWKKFNIEPGEFDFKTNKILNAYYVLRPENLESCFYCTASQKTINIYGWAKEWLMIASNIADTMLAMPL